MSDSAFEPIKEILGGDFEVWIVEDDPDIRELYDLLTQNLPGEVKTFSTYEEFSKEAHSRNAFDDVEALITDYNLIGTRKDQKTGIDVLQEFYSNSKNSYKHSALVTSFELEDLREEPLCDIYMRKDLNRDSIEMLNYLLMLGSAQEKKMNELGNLPNIQNEEEAVEDRLINTQQLMDEFVQAYECLYSNTENLQPDNGYRVMFERMDKFREKAV